MMSLPPSDSLNKSPADPLAALRAVYGTQAEQLEALGIRVWASRTSIVVAKDGQDVVDVPWTLAHYLADCIRLAADTQMAETKP